MSSYTLPDHLYNITQTIKNWKMKQRINVAEKGRAAIKPMQALGMYLAKSSVEKSLLDLVYLRVSQINSCAFCIDMHFKDLRAAGEGEHRLYGLDAWRESPFYSDRERVALSWAEALTKLNGAVSDAIYDTALEQFTEEELIDLTLAVVAINGFNRINLAFPNPSVVGTYKVGAFAHLS
jgi:AhpD family alkylhydroperoxidase